MPGIKCHRFLRTQLCWFLSNAEGPQAWLPGAQVYPELEDEAGSANVTPTFFYKNKIFVQIGVHIKMHIKL
jgi:hypothetical protein